MLKYAPYWKGEYMKKLFSLAQIIITITGLLIVTATYAVPPTKSLTTLSSLPPVNAPLTTTPVAPNLNAKGFIVVDANSNAVLAAKNPDQRMEPASLTKLMTLYVISKSLKEGRIHLDDKVLVSKKAWKTGGSRMFIEVDHYVLIRDLIKGIIVDSGNDACVAMAEHLAGDEEHFATMMNQAAQELGMKNSHYVDSTGLPNDEHYSTPRDLSILARALIKNFPEFYPWYKQKEFTYNNITQPNRNKLLWWDDAVDGMKTGHTSSAGYCLVASALRNGMRVVTVVMDADSDTERALDSQKLLLFAYRNYETRKLYAAGDVLAQPRIWRGVEKTVPIGIDHDYYVTIPAGTFAEVIKESKVNTPLFAPIAKGTTVGSINITLRNKPLLNIPLVALKEDPSGSIWRRMMDSISLSLHRLFGKDTVSV